MNNKRPFAVFDIDGTLIRWQLYHSLVDELGRRSYIDEASMQLIRNSRMNWKERRHVDTFKEYQDTLVRIFSSHLPNIPTNVLDEASVTVFKRYKDQVYTYTRNLITQLKNKNYVLFVISGSHHEIISKLAGYYGFDDAVGNTYERSGDKFTGKHQYIVERKPEVLRQLIDKHNVTTEGSLAIGDSASDASLLEMVEQPIAFNPDRQLYAIAKEQAWPIVVERKNVIYKLQPSAKGIYELL